MNKPDFQKAVIQHVIDLYGEFRIGDRVTEIRKESYIAGCEYAYSLMEKRVKELDEAIRECRVVFVSLSGETPSRITKIIDKALNPDNHLPN